MEQECDENLLCIPFTKEELTEIRKYAKLSGMEDEEFIRNVCLSHCLQQMECLYGQSPQSPEYGAQTARSENGATNGFTVEPRKVEVKSSKAQKENIAMKGGPTSKDLLDGPLILDQQCIMDLFAIKREFCQTSNNKIITIALKLGLNQLSVALDLLKHKLEE